MFVRNYFLEKDATLETTEDYIVYIDEAVSINTQMLSTNDLFVESNQSPINMGWIFQQTENRYKTLVNEFSHRIYAMNSLIQESVIEKDIIEILFSVMQNSEKISEEELNNASSIEDYMELIYKLAA